MIFRTFLIGIVLLIQRNAAQEELFEPMFIDELKVPYGDVLKAAESFHKYEFDEGVRTLGFPSSDFTMGGFRGTLQYNVAMFRGIKYATAKRFEMPKMEKKTVELVDAYIKGPSCPQPSADYFENGYRYSEDCLYLDVYVPRRRSVFVKEEKPISETAEETWTASEDTTAFENLPIIVAFQGEEFIYAESRRYDGRFMAIYGTAIVVIVNYRTGVLGFLSSGNDHIPGNYGLYDQKLAIEWVKLHAAEFGGNPEKITLLGFSSGAESVAAQMTNPSNSKDLFQRVILQSGVSKPGTIFASDKEAEMHAQRDILEKISELSECDGELVDCVKTMDIEKLIKSAGTLAYDRSANRTFGPVRDDNFFVENGEELLSQYDIMVGVVENEAGNWLGVISEDTTLYSVIKLIFASNSYFYSAPEYLVNFFNFEYRAYNEINKFKAVQRGFLKLVSDYLYVAPAVTFANRAAMAGAKTYLYEFQAEIAATESGKPDIVIGRSVHGDDQNFVFGFPLILSSFYPSSTRNVSANYLRMITNFAHSGDPDAGPNPKPAHVPSWNPFTEDDMGTYIISEEMEMKYKHFARTLSLWTSTVKYLMSDEVCGGVEIEPNEPPKVEQTPTEPFEQASCKSRKSTSSCSKKWNEGYLRWENEYIPRWKSLMEKYEQLVVNIQNAEDCAKDNE